MGTMRGILITLNLLVPVAVLAVTAGQAQAETIAGRASMIARTLNRTGPHHLMTPQSY
jgi:hypothetical protein